MAASPDQDARLVVNVRLRSSALDLVDELAGLDGTTRAAVLRRALSRGLPLVEKEVRSLASARSTEVPI